MVPQTPKVKSLQELLEEIADLNSRLAEYEELIGAIRNGEVDALAINKDGKSDIFTLESADYTYRLLVEKSNEGSLTLSETGIILFCNEYIITLFGTSSENILGTFIFDWIDKQDIIAFQEIFRSANTGNARGEFLLNFKDKKLPVSLS